MFISFSILFIIPKLDEIEFSLFPIFVKLDEIEFSLFPIFSKLDEIEFSLFPKHPHYLLNSTAYLNVYSLTTNH